MKRIPRIRKLSKKDLREYPEEIRLSVEKGLREIAEGKTVPHEEVMKKFKKWLK